MQCYGLNTALYERERESPCMGVSLLPLFSLTCFGLKTMDMLIKCGRVCVVLNQ